MIKRFRHKGLERLFATGNASGVAAQQARRIQLILAQLHVAHKPTMMDAPGLRFHVPKGDRKGNMLFRFRATGGLYLNSTARMPRKLILLIITEEGARRG